MKKRKKIITLLMDEWLLEKYTRMARDIGISRNALINLILRDNSYKEDKYKKITEILEFIDEE